MAAETEITPGPSAVDITLGQDGGVIKEITVQGQEGEIPLPGDKVFVHYIGTLTNGSQFDSSRDRGEKFSFNLGKGEVIKGWDLGVATMKRGERAIFFIRSEYGYGSTGSPPKIPGGATLVFDVELFDFQGDDITKEKDGGIIKRVVAAGEGYETPNDGSQVKVTLKGVVEGRVFDERVVEWELGEGLEQGIPRGLELALEKLKKNETAQITLKPKYGFGRTGLPDKGVPPEATLVYEVKLDSFEKSKESWQLDPSQKLEQARIFKDKGTRHFKDGKLEIASTRYQKVIEFLEHEISLKGAEEDERKSLVQAGRLNLAICHLKLANWIEARNVCDKVLEESPSVAKAWFRRGEANFALNDWEVAKSDFEKAVEYDAENKAAKNKILVCQQKIKTQKEKEKKTFANMFDKFAAIDQKREELEKKRKPDAMKNIDEWSGGEGGDSSGTENKDPNSIQVGGDVKMSLDLDEAIKEDQLQEQAEVNGH